MKDKRLLFFYPQNLVRVRGGAHRRAAELLEYFRARGYRVDLLTLDGFVTRWAPEDLAELGWLGGVHVCPYRFSPLDVLRNGWRVLRRRLPDLALAGLRSRAQRLAAQNRYDVAVVSYVFWGALAEAFPASLKVVDLHDFATLNAFLRSKKKRFRLGRMLEDEIAAVRRFDWALSISEEETLALSPFCPGTRFAAAPASFPERFAEPRGGGSDLFFVGGADNPFNREGLDWFFERVWPLLPPATTLGVAGDVCAQVPDLPGVRKLGRVESLDEAYGASRVVIAPLLGGTGLKIKVVEALSYGRPVVTTTHGLAGMLQKEDNGCLAADTPEGYAAAVSSLLADEGVYGRVRAQGMEFFRRRFSREAVWGGLDEVFLKDS